MKYIILSLVFITNIAVSKVCIVVSNFAKEMHNDVRESQCKEGEIMSLTIVNGQEFIDEWGGGLHNFRSFYCDHKYQINYEYSKTGKNIYLDCIYKDNKK